MVRIIVDGVIYTCLVFVFVFFAVFAMLFLRTAISAADANPLCATSNGSVKACQTSAAVSRMKRPQGQSLDTVPGSNGI